jgi:hypothetical protein
VPSHAGPTGRPGPLRSAAHEVLRRPEVLAAAVVDVESGLALDVVVSDGTRLEADALAAAQVEVLRSTVDLARVLRRSTTEIVVRQGEAVFHLVRPLPDPVGAGLAVAVLVAAPERNLRRVRKLLDRIDPRGLVPSGPPVRPAPAEAVGSPEVPAPRTPDAGDVRRVTVGAFTGRTDTATVHDAAGRSDRRAATVAQVGPAAREPAVGEPTAPFPVVEPDVVARPSRVAGPGDSRVPTGGLADVVDRGPGGEVDPGASDWFDPVVPGEPPPLRRSLHARPETDHLVLRRRF